jgi:PAS domain S-box-containing protein
MTAQSPALPSELFQTIVDEARDAVVVVDSAGRYVLANRAAADIYGMSPAEMIGRPIGTFSVDAHGTWELARAFPGQSEHRGEHRIYRPDGTSIDVEYTGTANVLPGLHVAIIRDVTAAKQQSRDYERTARRYRELFANASDVVYTTDVNGLLTEVNGAVERVLGYSEEELLGRQFSTLLPDDEVPKGVAMKDAIVADEHRTASRELTLRHRDGHYVETEVSARLMTCGAGKPTGFHGIVRDISERKRLERELRETAQRYQELFEEASDVIFTMDLEGNLLQLNGASERLFGWKGDELAGRNIRELMPPAYWPLLASPGERMARTPGEVVIRQYEMIGKDGGRVEVEVTSRVVWREGKPVAVHGVARDISERLEAERKVQESEARFRAVMNALPCGVWVWDGSEVTFVNPAMAEIAGRSLEDLPQDDESKSFLSLFEPEDAETMLRNGEQRLAGGEPPSRYEVRLRRPDGEIRWLEIHCTVVSRDGKFATWRNRNGKSSMRACNTRRSWKALACSPEVWRMTSTTCLWGSWATPSWR